VRFGLWYPLSSAGDHAPAETGILQLRLAKGLIDYPKGKSAMVHYAKVENTRAAALALASAHADSVEGLVCRHLIEIPEAMELGTFYAKLLGEFERRFGSPPVFPR
jgi:hypothetical protein